MVVEGQKKIRLEGRLYRRVELSCRAVSIWVERTGRFSCRHIVGQGVELVSQIRAADRGEQRELSQ